MRVDAHIHLFEHGYSGRLAAGEELAAYERLRIEHSIDRALVVGYEGDARFAGNNAYIGRLAATRDWIVPLHYLDPIIARAETVEKALAAGFAGFSLYLGADPAAAHRIPAEVWHAIGRHGALLSVNASPPALGGLAAVAEQSAGGVVLISHLGLPGPGDAGRSRMAELVALARHPHVLVKLSALYAVDPVFPHLGARTVVRAALDAFGSGRLVWGSDFAPGLDTVTADELFAVPDWVVSELGGEELLRLTGATLHQVLGGR